MLSLQLKTPRDSTPRPRILDVHACIQGWERKDRQQGKGDCKVLGRKPKPTASCKTIAHGLLWSDCFSRAWGWEGDCALPDHLRSRFLSPQVSDRPRDPSSVPPSSCPGSVPGPGYGAALRGPRRIKCLGQHFWPCSFIFVLFFKVTNSLLKGRRKEECTLHARETFSPGFSEWLFALKGNLCSASGCCAAQPVPRHGRHVKDDKCHNLIS